MGLMMSMLVISTFSRHRDCARQLHVGHHHKRVHKLQVQPAPLNRLANLDGIFQQLVFLIAALLLRARTSASAR